MEDLFNKYVVNDTTAALDSIEFDWDFCTTIDGWGKRNSIDICTLYEKFNIIKYHNITKEETKNWIAYLDDDNIILSINSVFDLDSIFDHILTKDFHLPAYMSWSNLELPRVFPYSHFPEYSLFSYLYHIDDDLNILNFLFAKMIFIMDGKYFKFGCQDKMEYHNRLTSLYLDFLDNYYPKFNRLQEFKEKDKKTYLVLSYKFYTIMRNYINSRMRTIARNLINLPGEIISLESDERLVYLSDMTTYRTFNFDGTEHEKIKHKTLLF